MSPRDPENTKTVVIIGGGPAGATCAESLRQEGFTGRIIMVCRENVVPYDRIKVSKVLDFDVQKATLRPPKFYDEHKIETKLGVEAIGTNKNKKLFIMYIIQLYIVCFIYIYSTIKLFLFFPRLGYNSKCY